MGLTWWQYGLVGGVALTVAALTKLLVAVAAGLVGADRWAEAPVFFAAVFGMGFTGGLVAWAGRGLSRRFGPTGDAVTGAAVMVVFFLACIGLFDPDLLGPKFRTGGLPTLGLAVPLGMFGGWLVGQDFRPR